MAEPLIHLEEISLRLSTASESFQGLNLMLARGSKIRLASSSNASTTALLRLIAGLTHPEQGRVILDQVPMNPYAFDHPFFKRGALGWVPPDGGLVVNMSLLANVALPLRFNRGLDRKTAEGMAMDALKNHGLEAFALKRPHMFDPRERWLGAMIRAAVLQPECWLVDRPLGSLDGATRKVALGILEGIAGQTNATLIVAGDGAWVPANLLQTVKLEKGQLNFEDVP